MDSLRFNPRRLLSVPVFLWLAGLGLIVDAFFRIKIPFYLTLTPSKLRTEQGESSASHPGGRLLSPQVGSSSRPAPEENAKNVHFVNKRGPPIACAPRGFRGHGSHGPPRRRHRAILGSPKGGALLDDTRAARTPSSRTGWNCPTGFLTDLLALLR